MKRILPAALILLLLLLTAAGTCAQVVSKYVYPVAQVSINRASAGVYVGRSITLVSRVLPASRAHETENVQWSSSDPTVATVAGGVVTGVKEGAVTITATLESKSATCAVRVRVQPPKGVRLNATAIAISQGDTFDLSANLLPAYAQGSIAFISGNQGIASISNVDHSTVRIKGEALGTTRVRARTSNGKVAYCTVRVVDSVRARRIALNRSKWIMSYYEEGLLRAAIAPINTVAEDKVVTWESSNPAIADVTDDGGPEGQVKAFGKPGRAIITATTGNGRSARCVVTVKHVAVQGLSFEFGSRLRLTVGGTRDVSPLIKPSNATNKIVTWTVGDPDIASVTEDGILTARATGKTRITARAGGRSAAFTLYVRSPHQVAVTITATGDVTIGGDPRRSGSASLDHYEDLYREYDGNFLDGVSEKFQGSDEITVVNLESCLTNATLGASKAYTLKAKPSYVDVLTKAGVDVVTHANNHTTDFMARGIRDTRAAVGGANTNMAYVSGAVTATKNVNGIKVGFCATNQTSTTSTATLLRAIKMLKSQRCHVIVASIHWGREFVYPANASQRRIGRAAVNAGADLVLGHHSHVVSGIEKYRGKYIVYGLGTLSSALVTPEDMDTFLFQQTFKMDAPTGLVESGGISLIPVSMSTDRTAVGNVNDARPVILAGEERQRVLNKIRYYSRVFSATVPEDCFS